MTIRGLVLKITSVYKEWIGVIRGKRRRSMENGKMRILLFAGTSEGRMLAEFLGNLSIVSFVSTATEYGTECVEEIPNIRIITGRMDEEAICGFIRKHQIQLVIDFNAHFRGNVNLI